MMFVPEGTIVSCGRNERLNTVPLPELPPLRAVPYRVLPDKINPACGLAPSRLVETPEELVLLAVKLCRLVRPEPLVLTANTVPWPELPPPAAAPYRVLPDKTNPACGLAPLLPPRKSSVVNPVPSVLMANTVRWPVVAVPYKILPDRINPAC